MTKEEHNQLLTQLRTASDVDRLNLISQLEQDYTGVLGQVEQTASELTKVTEERNKYALGNSDLWSRLQAQSKTIITSETDGTDVTDATDIPPQKMTYAALADKF